MNKWLKGAILVFGAFVASITLAIYGGAAVQTVAGLAVAQTGTLWNNVKDLAFGDNITTGVLAAGCTLYDGTNFDRCRGDTTNGLDVDVTRVSGSVTVVGNNTPSDNYANPTDAVDANALISGWDGSTWDRLLTSTHGDNITTTAGLNVAAVAYEFDGTNYDRVRNSFTQSTASITGAGAGTTVAMATTPMSNHTMQIDRTAGSTDAVEVDVECSLDGTDFTQIATITSLVGEPVLVTATGVACPNIRYNVVTVGSGNTLQIHLISTR